MQVRAFTPRSRSQRALTGRRKAPGALEMMEPFLAATYRTPAIIQVNLLFLKELFFSQSAIFSWVGCLLTGRGLDHLFLLP